MPRRVTCLRKYPTNELFKKWLETARDHAFSNGNKAHYVYGKALKSVTTCPVELKTANDAKNLDNVGEKIVKMLDDRLREFVRNNGEPTFENIKEEGIFVNPDEKDNEPKKAKKRTPRKTNPRKYIPTFRSGGYGIIRALYDAHVEERDINGPDARRFMERRELEAAAQEYCNESYKTAQPGKTYTAWSSINTLLRHDLIRMTRARGSTMQYELTDDGVEMGKQLTEADDGQGEGPSVASASAIPSALGSDSPPVSKKPRAKKKNASKSDIGQSSAMETTRKRKSKSPLGGLTATPDLRESSSTPSNLLGEYSPPRSKVMKNLARSPSPPAPLQLFADEDYYNEPDYGFGDDEGEIRPLAERISARVSGYSLAKNGIGDSVHLGYVYIDSDGFESRLQDEAYVSIDENEGSMWYLVKTTQAYVNKVGDQWRKCDDLPASITNNFHDDDGNMLMYLRSGSTDIYAPGIYETKADYQIQKKPDFGYDVKRNGESSVTSFGRIDSDYKLNYNGASSATSDWSTSDYTSKRKGESSLTSFGRLDPVDKFGGEGTLSAAYSSDWASTDYKWKSSAIPSDTTATKTQPFATDDDDLFPSKSIVSAASPPRFTSMWSSSQLESSQPMFAGSSHLSTSTVPKRVQPPTLLLPADPATSCSQASSTSSSRSTASLPSFTLEPGMFEIVLLVDHTEVAGGVAMFGEQSKNRKTFLTDGFKDLNIIYERRKLVVGDYLFVAREKNAGGAGRLLSSNSPDRELVLGPVIERKRMDDLASSIKDGRFHEQKSRLNSCGVYKVIYLIEEIAGRPMDTFGLKDPERTLRSAMIGTEVVNGFDIVSTKSVQDTALYLSHVGSYVRKEFSNKRLISRQPDSLSVKELIDMESDEIALPTFREFSELSVKRRPMTVGDALARSLMQFPGMSAEKAEAIRKVYPTLSHLIAAYDACYGDEDEENRLLEAIPCGHLERKLGPDLSKRIAQFFCAVAPFTK